MGVDGFRLDAVKHLVEEGSTQENTPSTHEWLKSFHQVVLAAKPYAFTIGEAWTQTDQAVQYVGDQVDAVFEFDLAQAMIDSVRQGNRGPVGDRTEYRQ